MKFVKYFLPWLLFGAFVVLWWFTQGNLRDEKMQNKALKKQYKDVRGQFDLLHIEAEKHHKVAEINQNRAQAYRDTLARQRERYYKLIRYHEKTISDIYAMSPDSAYIKLKERLNTGR